MNLDGFHIIMNRYKETRNFDYNRNMAEVTAVANFKRRAYLFEKLIGELL